MPFLVEKLEVYQKAVDFAERASELTESFPRGKYYLADQLNRAAVSIAANIAEGNGRYQPEDRRNFFVIARVSAQESLPFLEIARRRGPLKEHAELVQDLEVIVKMISGLIRRADEDGK